MGQFREGGRRHVASRATAEEFYGRCLGNVTTLDAAARRFASAGDSVRALAAASGADTYALQAVVWERILVASSFPQRQFFRVAEALVGGLTAHLAEGGPDGTAADTLLATRAGMLDACDPGLRQDVEAAWGDAGYLAVLPAPTQEVLSASVSERTGGLGVAAYAAARRAEASTVLSQAQTLRVKGDSVGAIQTAYESDLLALEAYLTESATALGDDFLMTVTIRWELATHAVASLPGLPDGFVAAVTRIRDALVAGLGDADGQRLRAELAGV